MSDVTDNQTTNQNTEKDFLQEDIQLVKKLQNGYARATAQIGQVEIELHLLTKRLESMKEYRTKLFEDYSKLQIEEKELVESLNEKYGDGVLDLDSGKFIPSNS
jgi:chromosome segregation ATPase